MITIIPAIDIIGGRCVRLTQGDFTRCKTYPEPPLAIAQRYEAAGVVRLHLVDLEGARRKQVVNYPVLKQLASHTRLRIDVGGGIHSRQDLEQVFDCGASQVTLGSIAVKQPGLAREWLEEFGAERLILGADVKGETIAIHAWEEQTELRLADFIARYREMGFREVICTDISRDGSFAGPALQRYQALKADFPEMHIIASGGIASISDVEALNRAGVDGVVIGKALLEGRIHLSELEPYLC